MEEIARIHRPYVSDSAISFELDRTPERSPVEMAVGVGFEPTVGVNPQSLSRRSRYGRFGTPPGVLAARQRPRESERPIIGGGVVQRSRLAAPPPRLRAPRK